MLRKIFDSLLTVAYPQSCRNCGGSVESSLDGAACGGCWRTTQIFDGTETLCAKCGAVHSANRSNHETFCHRCDEHFYDAASAVGVYGYALTASILHLKREPFVAPRLQTLFVSRFENFNNAAIDLIVPVPLSKKREMERGFNQAAVLAQILSRKIEINLDEKSLVRQIHTPLHRAGMDGKARAASVENAFAVKRPNLIKDKNILLVDDVFTSGATVSNCAEILKKSGAKRVYVLTLARAL